MASSSSGKKGGGFVEWVGRSSAPRAQNVSTFWFRMASCSQFTFGTIADIQIWEWSEVRLVSIDTRSVRKRAEGNICACLPPTGQELPTLALRHDITNLQQAGVNVLALF